MSRAARFPLLLHTMACPERDPQGAMDLAGALGLDGIELICQSGYRCAIAPDARLAEAQGLAVAAAARGLQIAALVPYTKNMNAMGSEARAEAYRELDRCLSLAAELGAGRIRLFAGDAVPAGDRTAAIARMAEILRPLGDRAENLGISFCIENHMDTMATSAAATREVVDAIAHPAFGILYDQANLDFMHAEAFPTGFDIQSAAIWHVHVKDFVWNGDGTRRATVVGEGIVPWKAIIEALLESGYSGPLSFEYERRWVPDELPPAQAGVARSHEYIRRLLASAETETS